MRSGESGSVTFSSTPRRRAAGIACSAADSTAARRSSGRRSRSTRPGIELGELEEVLGQPVEPLQLDPARVEELRTGGGVLAGLLGEQLVEREERRDRRPQFVGDVGEEVATAVAIAPDDRDALLQPIGHRVELDRELRQLRRARLDVGSLDALGEIALGECAGGLGQTSERGGEAASERGGDDDRQAEGHDPDGREQARDVGNRGLAERVRVREA